MELICQEEYYKDIYCQVVKEYKAYLYHKKLIDRKKNKTEKNLLCPICKSINKDVSIFCENCGAKLNYSFLNYLY